MIKFFLVFLGWLFFSNFEALQAEANQSWKVGYRLLTFEDPNRLAWDELKQRPIVTHVWYPAISSQKETLVQVPSDDPVFIGGLVVVGGTPLVIDSKMPLVVMSHGTGGSAFQMMWLARALVQKGFIVAAVDHHGNTAAEPKFDPRGFRLPWYRIKDLTFMIDSLTNNDTFGRLVDFDRIGAVGFSLGGYTVTGLAGGKTHRELFSKFCKSSARDATCDAQVEYPEADRDLEILIEDDPSIITLIADHRGDYSDSRLRSVVMLAPALGKIFEPESLAAIKIPALVIVGDEDATAPLETNGAVIANAIPTARLEVIQGGNHYAYLNSCTVRVKQIVDACKDGTKERHKVQIETITLVLKHLKATL